MAGITLLVSIILIVFGVLQIILFFKLWGMTNDVVKISKQIERLGDTVSNTDKSSDFIWKVRRAILKGNQKDAEDIIADNFITELQYLWQNYDRYGSDNFIQSQYQNKITELKNRYVEFYSRIGTSMPEPLHKINTASDINALFK